MKKMNIAATGYYGSTESWKWVASAYEMIAEVLGKLVHPDDPVIITGVDIAGSNVSDGFISYAGELFFFKGGQKTDTVVIIEEVTEQEYNTSASGTGTLPTYPTYINRYAKCGQPGEGVAEFPHSSMIRIDNVKKLHDLTRQATENAAGIMEIATQAEVDAGTDDLKALTPKKLNEKIPKVINNFFYRGEKNIENLVQGRHYYQIDLPVSIPNANYTVQISWLFDEGGETNDIPIMAVTRKFDDYFIVLVISTKNYQNEFTISWLATIN